MTDCDDSLESEIWKPLFGWAGYYEASSCGRIRSLPRTKRHKSKKGLWFDMPIKGKILKSTPSDRGYACVQLSANEIGRKPVRRRVNRLVCQAFHGDPVGDRNEAAHNNGCRDDNRASNLRWATRSENMSDVRAHRLARQDL